MSTNAQPFNLAFSDFIPGGPSSTSTFATSPNEILCPFGVTIGSKDNVSGESR